MYVLSLNVWFQKLMRQFFFNIDSVIFNFISAIYDLLISIARTSVLSQADIIDMADRIYKLLAIFMVFKVTFSLIMYVVNPDDFSDKSKGISKLGTNIIISLVMLIITPYVFNMAYTLQTIVLEDNAIAALIFGDDNEENDFLNSAGDSMAFISMRPFFMPNVSIDEMADCTTLDDTCFSGMEKLTSDDGNFTNTMITNYKAGIGVSNLGLMFRQDLAIATDEDNDNFIMDYKYLFSTVIGIVIILLLITFCMDVAVRSIKLAFLQLIAPIPIISYVDPKSGKDGLFKKWYQMCFKTYLSLFIRILALYFAVYIISKIGKMVDIIDGSYQTNALIAIFIIIGALMFAKQLPKILEGLGIKLDGGFQLNPIKKFEKDALGGKRITGMAGGMLAAGADRAARIATAAGAKNKLRALGGAPLGLLGGAARGFSSNGGFTAGRDKQSQVNRRLREGRINGLSPTASYLDYMGSKFGLDDATLEKEGTLIRKNEDAIREAETKLENDNRNNTLAIDQEKKDQVTRKNTKSKFDAVQKQGKRLLDKSEDFVSKKGNFGVYKKDADLVDYLRKNKGQINTASTNFIPGMENTQGAIIDDEMIVNAEQYANRRQYKVNRDANSANVQYLIDHNGETLNSTFKIKDKVFKAGTKIDGNLIAEAQSQQGMYIKESQKAVTNEMERLYNERDNLTNEDLDFYTKNKSDIDSFGNIKAEFDTSVNEANTSVSAYNGEYTNKIEGIYSTPITDKNTGKTETTYDVIKRINGDMESGISITEMNNELAKSDSKIQTMERENEERRRNTKVEYYDESGKVTHDESIDAAKSKNKSRDENHKRKLKQHQERRSFRGDIGLFNSKGGKK